MYEYLCINQGFDIQTRPQLVLLTVQLRPIRFLFNQRIFLFLLASGYRFSPSSAHKSLAGNYFSRNLQAGESGGQTQATIMQNQVPRDQQPSLPNNSHLEAGQVERPHQVARENVACPSGEQRVGWPEADPWDGERLGGALRPVLHAALNLPAGRLCRQMAA